MNIGKMFPSKYVKAHDLPADGVVVTMSHVKQEKMGQPPQDNWVLYFERATKGMVLNQTNATTIAALHGPETDEWKGKRIRLYATWVQAFGKNNHVIRVAEEVPSVLSSAGSASAPPGVNDDEDLVDVDDHADEDLVPESAGEDSEDDPGQPTGNPVPQALKLAESVYGTKFAPRFSELVRLVSDQKTSSPAELDGEQQIALLDALRLRRELHLAGAKKHGNNWQKYLKERIRLLSSDFFDHDSELEEDQIRVLLRELSA